MIMVASVDEKTVRIGVFVGGLLLLALWERITALGGRKVPRVTRWPANVGLTVIDTALLRVLFPAGAVGIAMFAAKRGFGLFNLVPLPNYAVVVIGLMLLDLVIYFQHRVFHSVRWLWRIHRVHHADPELDVSTALRFHPAEAFLSMLLKAFVVLVFGLPAACVLIFEVVLNAAAMFNHASVRLPGTTERWVNWLLVTPEMHRVHHSKRWNEANRNFGFSVSLWDRIFRTYRGALHGLGDPPSVGLPDGPTSPSHTQFWGLLRMPWGRGSVRN